MSKDFFISYNKADRAYAAWIASQLEAAGYTTIFQDWDFRPGCNFVLEMQQGARDASRLLAVLSPDYLAAEYTHPEWAVAFAQDPTGRKRSLIPVRVRECQPEGILAQIVFIDLIGLDEEPARAALLEGMKPGRRQEAASPFPTASNRPTSPTAVVLPVTETRSPSPPPAPTPPLTLPSWDSLPESARTRVERLIALLEVGDFARLKAINLGLASSEKKIVLIRRLHEFIAATVKLKHHITAGNLATTKDDVAACLMPLAEPAGLYAAYTDVLRRVVLAFASVLASVLPPRGREHLLDAIEGFAQERGDHVLHRQLRPLIDPS